MRLLLLLIFLSTGDPRVKLSALVVFSVANLDLFLLLGNSTDNSYLGLLEPWLVVSENTSSSEGDEIPMMSVRGYQLDGRLTRSLLINSRLDIEFVINDIR